MFTRILTSALVSIALTAGAAGAQAASSPLTKILEIARQVEAAPVCPTLAASDTLNLVSPTRAGVTSTEYFAVNMVASEFLFKDCLNEAELLFAFVAGARDVSEYDRDRARDGLARVLARR